MIRSLKLLAILAAALVLALARVSAAQDGHDPAHPAEPAAAQDAHAEDGHAVHEKGELLAPLKQGLPAMIAAFITFGIVYFALQKVVWPKISQGLEARAEKIRAEIEAAEKARAEAKAALDQYQKSLSEARGEAQKILEQTKVQQQELAADLRAKAEQELVALKDRARRDIDAAKRDALAEIYEHTATLSTAVASKILKREINASDQKRLIDESIGEMQAGRR